MSIREVFITALLSAAVVAGSAIAATQHDHTATPPTAAAQAPAMDHQKMMADLQAEQAKLDDLLAQMNAATGPEKVDRIAAVVTEMAAEHKHMTEMMGGMMQGGMMQQHMNMPGQPQH